MRTNLLISLGLLGVGIVLLALGFNVSRAPVEQATEALTGTYSGRTMWYLIGGGIALTAGLVLAFAERRA